MADYIRFQQEGREYADSVSVGDTMRISVEAMRYMMASYYPPGHSVMAKLVDIVVEEDGSKTLIFMRDR